MCDSHSQTTYDCGEAVYQMASRVNNFRLVVRRLFHLGYFDSLNILLIARLEIEPPYRGRGIGLTVLSRLIKRWGKDCSLAVMKPYPLQYAGKDADDTQEFKKAYRKLVQSYAPLGFTKIPSSSKYGKGHYGLSLMGHQTS